jgi:hypothetical protein
MTAATCSACGRPLSMLQSGALACPSGQCTGHRPEQQLPFPDAPAGPLGGPAEPDGARWRR